ncbi:MAG TPA: hypothetical protein VGS57_09080 [Thermoanaerobaculia bacterium]|jgi:hypothetical protein|nr:hypothetical protein [Thermoanaerobaculia bacterium]
MTTTPRSRSHRLASWALAGAAALTSRALPAAAAPVPLGPETALDSPLALDFSCPVLAGRDDGSSALTWVRGDSANKSELVLRTADSAGLLDPAHVIAQRPRFRIDRVSLAAHPAGYTLLWRDFDGVRRRTFFAGERDADGAAVGAVVDLGHAPLELSPRPVGGFVAGWIARRAVNVQLLDEEGGAARPPVKIGTPRGRAPIFGGVVHAADGSFLVFWHQQLEDFAGGVLVARRFDVLGRPQGRTFQLVAPPGERGFLSTYTLALGDDGTLAVAYRIEREHGAPQPELLLLRTFDAADRPLQESVVLDQDTTEFALAPDSVAVDAAGNALVLWTRLPGLSGGSTTTHAAVLQRSALAVEPFDLTSPASADFPSVTCAVAAAAGDSWIVAWVADDDFAFGLLDRRLFARRFRR